MNTLTVSQKDFFSICYLDYRGIIMNYISSRIPRTYEAEDLLQDVFIRLWEHREFVNRDTVKSLLFTIARNLITDKIRRHYKMEEFYSYAYISQAICRNTTDEVVTYNELNVLHNTAIKELPNKRRHIYEMCFRQDMSSQDIAGRLSISTRTVEGQLLLARKGIRAFLREHSYENVS